MNTAHSGYIKPTTAYKTIFDKIKNYQYDQQNVGDFCADVAQAYEMVGMSIFDRCWYFAWSEGHSNGFTEILHYFDEAVGLLEGLEVF